MLVLACIFDLVNIVLGFLDFLVIGLILSPIWNFVALGTLGLWLFIRTGQGVRGPGPGGNKRLAGFLAKRIVIPFVGNSIPIAKFFPFWVWSVWGSLDKGFSSQAETGQQEGEGATQDQKAAAPEA